MLCAAVVDPDAAWAALDGGWLCGLATAELTELLGTDAPPVVMLAVNDERIADPATLVVLLHVHALTDAVAFAVTLYRNRPDAGAPPFFLAPPEAMAVRSGSLSADEVRERLRRLLGNAVARPLRGNRFPTSR